MKRFFNDLKKYKNYVLYSAWSELKQEVINSYLGWIWIVLEPFCFMLIYTFIASIVFKSSEPYFPVFVYIGLTMWNFFNKNVVASVKLMNSNKDIVTKVYLPKYVLIIQKMIVNGFKMIISFGLVFIFMLYYGLFSDLSISLQFLYIIPITLILIIFTFGICCIFMHIGVFIEDMVNLTNIGMRFVFYLSGIFYSIPKRLPLELSNLLLKLNPIAFFINEGRTALLYGSGVVYIRPDLIWLIVVLIISVILSIIGVRIIYKSENTYVKVMK